MVGLGRVGRTEGGAWTFRRGGPLQVSNIKKVWRVPEQERHSAPDVPVHRWSYVFRRDRSGTPRGPSFVVVVIGEVSLFSSPPRATE